MRTQLVVDGWTVRLGGRVDGLVTGPERTVVEEVKSTALGALRLLMSSPADWPEWTAQLEVYLWILAREDWPAPEGRLVLISLLDGARHLLGVQLDRPRLDAFVRTRLQHILDDRQRRLDWLANRRGRTVPWPFPGWRAGQREIGDAVGSALVDGAPLLAEAPTGLGKTAAVLWGALRHALAHDKQLFWATSRNTQQAGVEATVERFRAAGLPVRSVRIQARERVCLNDVVACRPESCRYAERYHDKIVDASLVERAVAAGAVTGELLAAVGEEHEVCPAQLALDVSSHADLVIGDYNYAFAPGSWLRRHFGPDNAGHWIVVGDEAHQLVERARGWRSPRVEARVAREASAALSDDPRLAAFAALAARVCACIDDVADRTRESPEGRASMRNGVARAELAIAPWSQMARQVDELAMEYALRKAKRGDDASGDPYLDLARSLLSFRDALDAAGEETVALVDTREGSRAVSLLCLDPSAWLAPRIARLGGWIGASATLSPPDFYRDLLGLCPPARRVVMDSPFDPTRRAVLLAPRISTAWRDRAAHAGSTAEVIADVVRAVPGHVAVYFPSFAMLEDIASRWELPERDVLLQTRGMRDRERSGWLERLARHDRPVLLAAVLGGIFAEGIDLPGNLLAGAVVVGPGFPPVGLERDLLREHYERRYGQGFRYATIVPGLTKVIQAAGRVVRTPEDRGVVVLVGRRFRWRDIAGLLPRDWNARVAADPAAAVSAFWASA